MLILSNQNRSLKKLNRTLVQKYLYAEKMA